jgi:long-chain acyl-CoA synthetase
MRRETLLDFFEDFASAPGEFLVYDDGFRSTTYTYADTARAARAMALRLQQAGVGKGDKVLIWCENRPEWIVALWGCLLAGAVIAPVDYRASADMMLRVRSIVNPSVSLIGEETRWPDNAGGPPPWRLSELDWREEGAPAPVEVSRDDLAEIIFTSGATSEPKGVKITHRNILANIVPVEREILKYRKWGRPFFPLRFLNLLPLSHMFGQAMATFIPPVLPGVVVFLRGYNPDEIIRQIRRRRISVLVSVPKILEVLRDHIRRLAPVVDKAAPHGHFLLRWWRYRNVHRLFGWKFWAAVVGAAPLAPELEEFWSKLGYLVIQGYGLTETAPIVTLNHPFHARKGTVGSPIAAVEVKIAPDGEILVRGENVTAGYFHATAEDAATFADGWLHTGDIGEMDEAGRLVIRGRKKEMIVTPEGLNVFPEDVERVLNSLAGVRDSAAVGRDRVEAVLVLEPGVDPDDVVRQANARLEDHQKVRRVAVWPGTELPRTEGTRKLKRREIARWLETGVRAEPQHASDRVQRALARFAHGRAITPQMTLDELGLSSLERVELMMDLNMDEAQFTSSSTVGELLDRSAKPRSASPPETTEFPEWNRARVSRWVRNLSLATWILPIARIFVWPRVEGLEHLRCLRPPVIFAPNHQSHLDVPAILLALPYRWRHRVAPAMSKEFFAAHFHPQRYSLARRFTNGLNYYLSTLFFNAFPLPQREAGALEALRYAGQLVSEGWCILIFPEGKRTERGEINPFQPGVAMMASKLGVPVVPVRLEGVDRVLHQSWKMAKPGRVSIRFGPPLRLAGEDYAALARQVEEAVRSL